MEQAKARGRGRPREYDERAVLEAVLGVFWRRGYSGATLPDLAEAAGITRPSLYTALGDKLSMYLRSLEHFRAALETQLSASLDPSRSIADGLSDFYETAIALYFSDAEQPRGCLVFCTAAAEAVEEPAIREVLSGVLDEIDRAFERRMAAEAPNGSDVKALGGMASATLHSLAVRARAGQSRAQLEALAATAANTLAAAIENMAS
jgi:TetR/AcrR family transcriptional regulator, copper-responsive repressor